MKIHADVSRRPVHLTVNEEPAALGAAIWAGIGAGLFEGYTEAIARMVHHGEVLSPDEASREIYDFYYHQYVETYHRLKPLMAEMAEFEERREMGRDGNSKKIE